MAVSGSIDFDLNRNQIIREALLHIGAISVDDTMPTVNMTQASRRLNTMVQSWANEDIQLWNVTRVTTELIKSKGQYILTNLETITDGTVDVTISSSDITFSTAPGTDVTGWTFAVSTFSTTIATHTAGATTATLTDAYTLASDSTATYTLTSDEQTTHADSLDMEEAYIRNTSTSEDRRLLQRITREEFMNIPDKETDSTPTRYFVEYTRSSLVVNVHPRPDNSTTQLNWAKIGRLDDFDSSTDNADFPVRWMEALITNLGYNLSFSYGIPLTERQLLKIDADEKKSFAMNNDNERGQLLFSPDLRERG